MRRLREEMSEFYKLRETGEQRLLSEIGRLREEMSEF
jgi:hypothetical protein